MHRYHKLFCVFGAHILEFLPLFFCACMYFMLEHEACAMDINELNWHVGYRGRIEDRNQKKVQVSEALNGRLKEDISFVKGHM